MNTVTLRTLEKLSLFYYGLNFHRTDIRKCRRLKMIYMDFVQSQCSISAARLLIDEMCEYDKV